MDEMEIETCKGIETIAMGLNAMALADVQNLARRR
jgi:hypothetical protein